MLIYLLFIIGFILLIKGADLLVDGASSVAKKLKISAIVIGLTIVAFGTSMPELIVNIFASVTGNNDIAIGNILGSNIANILLILGICAIIFPLATKENTVWKEIPLSLLAAVMVGIMANDWLIDKNPFFSGLGRIDGLIFLSLFVIFMYYIVDIAKADVKISRSARVQELAWWKSIIFIIAGLLALIIGGKWIVDGAVHIASILGVSQSLIGLTIVAVGTSLPELATSAVAAYKRNADIAIGNIVGSNIFNIFWILGISALIRPIAFKPNLNIDILVTISASLILFLTMFIGKKHLLERWQGVVMVILYFVYIAFLVVAEKII